MLQMVLAFSQALSLGGGLLRTPTTTHMAARGMLARHAAVRPAMVSLPFGGGGASGPSEETLAAYRLMGLDLDATYDEIERAFDDLSASYAGDPKRKIKLAVAKDKILEDRLRQRMSGSLQGFTGVKDPYDIPEGPKPFFKIPPRLQGVMELPDKNLLIKNVIVFGLIGILPAAAAEWAATSIAIGFGVSFYLLYNRGVESSEMEAEMRPPKTKPLLMAAGISLLSGMLGGTILVGILGKILSFISPELLIGLGTAAGYCFAATLFKVPDTLR